MKAEAPAQGIMKTGDYGDSKWYKVSCSCGQPDHDITFEVEVNDGGEIVVNTYIDTKTDYWTEALKKRYDIDNPWMQEIDWAVKEFINGLVRRLKFTWKMWTKGYIRTESTTVMTKQQALNYAETLKQAIKDLETFKAKDDGNS